jgi:arylsulfatase A-like enzyme
VLDSIKAHGMESNTLAVFSSDHGPHVELCLEGGTAAGLRGGKGDSSWEGGLRVPGIMYFPGTIAPGLVSSELVSTMDVSMTMLALAGGSVQNLHTGGSIVKDITTSSALGAAPRIMDGRSLVPLVTGVNASSPHEALFHYCGDTLMAVRYKEYKLRYYTEQLPFENYSTVHCTAGRLMRPC